MAFTVTGSPKDGDSFSIVPSAPELSVFENVMELRTNENQLTEQQARADQPVPGALAHRLDAFRRLAGGGRLVGAFAELEKGHGKVSPGLGL